MIAPRLGGYPRRVPRVRAAAIVTVGVLVVAALVITVAVAATIRRPLPEYSGEVELRGLDAEVTVVRGERGIPQVYASTSEDLFKAQGYVHAQDRFFEMDFRRHVTAGRLAELVGDSESAIEADMVIRTLGWRRVAEAELPLLAPETRAYLQAYADGVNAYLADKSPSDLAVAYTVLGQQVELEAIEPWEPVDSLAWFKAMAWDLKANYTDEMGRALTYGAVGGGEAADGLVAQLYPAYPTSRHMPIIATDPAPAGAALAPAARADTADVTDVIDDAGASPALRAAHEALDAVPVLLGRGEGIGSNSWVVAGEHTATGSPLLANDPHLAGSMPGIWYQVGLHCTEVGEQCPFDVAGFSFSGTPGVVIGHNADVAWGMTNLGADVTDFFLERVAGDTYLRDGQQVPLETRTEVIEVAGGEPREIEVRSTVHGPIVSDVIEQAGDLGSVSPVPPDSPIQGSGYEVALQWTALTPGRTADAIFALNAAGGWDDFRAAAALFEVPSQNLVYADTEGNIGYQAPGVIPVRGPGTGRGQTDGTWPRLGWHSAWDWKGTIPFEDLPTAFNPDDGFIVTANQAVTGPESPNVLTRDWAYGYRSQRIREQLETLIAEGGGITAAQMNELQNDTRNGFAPVLVPSLIAADLGPNTGLTEEAADFTTEAVALLLGWDYDQPPESAAAAYYNAVWTRLLDLTFADQLQGPIAPDGGGRWFEVVRSLLENNESVLWDDTRTSAIRETRDQIIAQALHEARLDLTSRLGKDPEGWEWGKLHQMRLEASPLGGDGVPEPVRALFNPDAVDVGGGTSIVNATAWDAAAAAADGDYEVTALPSMRMVVDLADPDASTWVDLTGVSAHPWSPHYGDQTGAWAEGETYPWPFSREAVAEAERNTLVLRPLSGP